MFRNIRTVSIVLAMTIMIAGAVHAQVKQNETDKAANFDDILTRANETATFENGKIKSIRIPTPGAPDALVTFEHSDDGNSFTLTDEKGKKIKVGLDEHKRISYLIFPDGTKVNYSWTQTPTNFWVVSRVKYDFKNPSQPSSLADCYDICEAGAAAATIAIGVCYASGPLSVPCATATATAAYAAYRCYRCNYPQIEEPPQNLN